MLADDIARPDLRPEALSENLSLLFNRPTTATIAAGVHLDPPRWSGHMTTLMTAPYRTVPLDRRMLAIHA
jgi:hypothetical protein